MRKFIAAGAMTVASLNAIPTQAETPASRFEGAPHGITEACAAKFIDLYDPELLSQLTTVDIQRAVQEDPPTASDARERGEALELDSYPLVRDYIEQHTNVIQRFRLPRSLISFEIVSDVNNWWVDPELFETVIEQSLSSRPDHESLQALSYQCLQDEIYGRRTLAYKQARVAILGAGDLCIASDRVVPRGQGLCVNEGWFYGKDGLMVVTPRDPKSGSETTVHEFDHWYRKALDIKPDSSEAFEYGAYTFEDIAAGIMAEQDAYPLKQDVSCVGIAYARVLC